MRAVTSGSQAAHQYLQGVRPHTPVSRCRSFLELGLESNPRSHLEGTFRSPVSVPGFLDPVPGPYLRGFDSDKGVGPNAVNFRFECFLGHEEHEGYTKCAKENHCQGSCMGRVFLCFLFFVFDQYFSGSKAHKGASPDRFS